MAELGLQALLNFTDVNPDLLNPSESKYPY